MRVHMRGHFVPARHAIAYWRDLAKAGEKVDGRIVNTSSGAGLMGSIGQGNYVAAKAGIAAAHRASRPPSGAATACSPTPSPPTRARA